ncbi:Gfo/Idh/MocA family protein [Psychromicrobium lacuslunae]|uniref:Oxidoreductase n=1 Tax=Psychromicrobium lacuslunae TaxID=1618207 RepID=A0A0D4C0X4_9MICC|nr:Gfo/Idh/MocA family oxidoreductase [Psychromicrobium lacuslunae]AJT42243.1 oxidoreductase [Psychromicrobium lacuslunae]
MTTTDLNPGAKKTLKIAAHGVTGRMGYRQHLLRSLLPLRETGLLLEDGSKVEIELLILGRDQGKIKELASKHHIAEWSTDVATALTDPSVDVFFDAATTTMRPDLLHRALTAGKHIYSEKPTALDSATAISLARAAAGSERTSGVVHDKLYLPGLVKLRRLIDQGFFGRLLSLRGEFGYWVFEGDTQAAQRPSWNYRKEDGGGITTDMFCHWNYVLEGLIGPVRSVDAKIVTHIPQRWDEQGKAYQVTADDAAYGSFELEGPDGGQVIAQINSSWAVRVHRDELVEFQLDGTEGSAVAGLFHCVAQHRANTPKPVWNPDLPVAESFREQWFEVPDNAALENGFAAQWQEFLRDCLAGRKHRFDLLSAARGVQLAELGLAASSERRTVDVPEIGL